MHFLGEESEVGSSDNSGGQGALVLSNPDTMIEIDFQELGLQESKLEYYCQLQGFLNSTVDDVKKSVGDHVLYDHDFKLLRRHFQLQLWVEHRQTWERVDFDSTVRESLNLSQVGLRLARYHFKVVLNPGQTPATCGRP